MAAPATPNANANANQNGNANQQNGGGNANAGNPNGNNSQNNNNNNNQHNNNNNQQRNTSRLNLPTIDKGFEGLVPEIDAVMGMFFEKNLENCKSYTMFKKAVLVYMESQQYKHAEYVNRVFTNYVDK